MNSVSANDNDAVKDVAGTPDVAPCPGGTYAGPGPACSGTARRELLSSRKWDVRDRSTDVFATVTVATVVGLALGLIPVLCLSKVTSDKSVLKWVYALLVIGAALWAYVATRYYGESLWESTNWLDFDERSWNQEIRYTDGSAPTSLTRLRFDDLALMCYDSVSGDDRDEARTYHVSLCRRRDVEQRCAAHRPDPLDHLMALESEEESLAFAFDTARKWDLPCWRHDCPTPSSADRRSMTRLC